MLGRKELTKGSTTLRVVTVVVIPTLTYTDVKLGLYRQGAKEHKQAMQMNVLWWIGEGVRIVQNEECGF